MPTNNNEIIKSQETYTEDQKKLILERLNNERLKRQKENLRLEKRDKEISSNGKKTYAKEEKRAILERLNQERLSQQRYRDIKRNRTLGKKIYSIKGKDYYMFKDTPRPYYILVEDLNSISGRPSIHSLYYKGYDNEFIKKDMLMKIKVYSEKIFISSDVIRIKFEEHSLENER